jgi:hypothetical protein
MRFYADLNPAYPSRGEHRWRVFRVQGLECRSIGKSYRSRRSAEAAAVRAYVDAALGNLGFAPRELEQ